MRSDRDSAIPLWRDERFWRIALQALAIVVLVGMLIWLGTNFRYNLQQQNLQFGFNFLQNSAGFDVSDSLIEFQPSDPYYRVLLVGLINSLRVMILGVILTTFVGVAAGVASFSQNWLVSSLSRVYVEIVQNTPLLLQLLFWYLAVFFRLPNVQEKIALPGHIFLSKQGIFTPWPTLSSLWFCSLGLILSVIAALIIWRWRTQVIVEQGKPGHLQSVLLGTLVVIAGVIIGGLKWEVPEVVNPTTLVGGLRLTIEFSGLLVGLVLYTGAFIAEIVRAGIQSVDRGQWEAARSLGLKPGLVMRLVVFPQALQVIIPPLTNQYVNLAKNSSLGIAIGYTDIYAVANTTYNQAGRPVEVMLILMLTYLTINLVISGGMNLVNQWVKIQGSTARD